MTAQEARKELHKQFPGHTFSIRTVSFRDLARDSVYLVKPTSKTVWTVAEYNRYIAVLRAFGKPYYIPD